MSRVLRLDIDHTCETRILMREQACVSLRAKNVDFAALWVQKTPKKLRKCNHTGCLKVCPSAFLAKIGVERPPLDLHASENPCGLVQPITTSVPIYECEGQEARISDVFHVHRQLTC